MYYGALLVNVPVLDVWDFDLMIMVYIQPFIYLLKCLFEKERERGKESEHELGKGREKRRERIPIRLCAAST